MDRAFGILNSAGNHIWVNGLQDYRPIGAFSFLGRYRAIDFPISNMTNSGIDRIQVYIRRKPRSVVEHLGTGRHYNINSKRGGIEILYGENVSVAEYYNTDVASFKASMRQIIKAPQDYVVIAPTYMVYKMDYEKFLNAHIESGADVTIAYKSVDDASGHYVNCDTLKLNKQKGVESFGKNQGNFKTRQISMETYVMSKKLFIELIDEALKTSSLFWFRDILNQKCEELDIRGYQYRGYLAAITDLTAYYEANMELIDPTVSKDLFNDEDWQIYTRTNDSPPTKYTGTSQIKRSVISNGCTIEGTVENSVVGRGCVVKKGAVVRNAVILPGAIIGEDVEIDNVVVDKEAVVAKVKNVKGVCGSPAYVRKGDRI